MSIRTKRIVARVCIVLCVAIIVLRVALAISGHLEALAGCGFPAAGVTGGLVYLRSTRGRS